MSSPKQKKVFDEPLTQDDELSSEFLFSHEFEDDEQFVPLDDEQDSTPAEMDIEPVIRPSRRKRWGVIALVTAFIGLVGWQAGDSFYRSYIETDWLAIGWSSFVLILAFLGASRLLKEFIILRRLKQHFSQQETAEKTIEANEVGAAVAFCEKLNESNTEPAIARAIDEWRNTITPTHTDAEVMELYDIIVLKIKDEQAIRIVSKYSTDSAVLVAMSPLAIADMMLVIWRSFKMIDELSKLYHIELGYWSRIHLLKMIFINMALAGASEVAMDAGFDLLSAHITGKISSRVGQGVGIGVLTARLGIQAMKVLRPIPWFPRTKPRLSAVSKHLVSKVVGLLNKQAKKD